MKRTVMALVALTLLAVTVLGLASCTKKPSGKYGSTALYLEFSGSKVTAFVLGVEAGTGSYTIDDAGNIKITADNESDQDEFPTGLVYDADNDEIKSVLGALKKMK